MTSESVAWTAPEVVPIDEPFAAEERVMLDGWLEFHLSELLHKCGGLTSDQLLRRSVAPSTLSLLGLIRHLTEVERTWFRRRFADEAVERIYDSRDAAFEGAHPAEAARDYAALIEEWALCRSVSEASLDQTYTHPDFGEMSLRWIYVHMIREYAGHCGHADLLRQAIDGRTFS